MMAALLETRCGQKGSIMKPLWAAGRAAMGQDRASALKMLRGKVAEETSLSDPVSGMALHMSAVSSCEEGGGGEEDIAILDEVATGREALAATCSLAMLAGYRGALAACEGVLMKRAGMGDDGTEAVWGRLRSDHVSFALPGGGRPLRELMRLCKGLAVRMLPLCACSMRDAEAGGERMEFGRVVTQWLSEDPSSLSAAGGAGGGCMRMLVGVCVGWAGAGEELAVGDAFHAALLGCELGPLIPSLLKSLSHVRARMPIEAGEKAEYRQGRGLVTTCPPVS